ncbi:cadherin domain-containing protein [Crateriforma spongiae]|uniref:cadherin domain-containing protein n=1 Tax=Crateriforma spongiae TaxID=2724528 RepID=UPI0014482E12|nr:cadherin domain-containing protein [Crateriforma spongiae]
MNRTPDTTGIWQTIVSHGESVSRRGRRYLQRTQCRLGLWWDRNRAEPGLPLVRSSRPQIHRPVLAPMTALEPRILYSATPLPVMPDAGVDPTEMVVEVAEVQSTTDGSASGIDNTSSESIHDLAQSSGEQIVFVDSSVSDYQTLIGDLAPETQVFVLDGDSDGVDQITRILDGLQDVGSIHIVSHGEDGTLRLGNAVLSADRLDAYAGTLSSWEDSLTSDADILLYGCDLASNADGRTLIESMATLTGADVAASDDDTGHQDFSGDWELEYSTGRIETDVFASQSVQDDWKGKLATITVDTFDDVVASDGLTSLREAVQQANADGGSNQIVLGGGTYTLDDFANGTLTITSDITFIGVSATDTLIDADGLGTRPFTIQSGSDVLFRSLSITGGVADQGGAVMSLSGSSLTMRDVELYQNQASQFGGAIHSAGSLQLQRVTIAENSAGEKGGAIYINGGTGDLSNVTISGNAAHQSAGAILNYGGNVTLTNSTVADNSTGIDNENAAVTQLKNTILDNAGQNAADTLTSLGYNIDSDGSAGLSGTGDQNNVDPKLGALDHYGGGVRTHSLHSTSTAIDNGNSAGAVTLDGRRFARDTDIDIGAFEYQAQIHVNQTTSGNQTTDGEDKGVAQAVDIAADGSFVVVWSSEGQDSSGYGVYARRFNANGIALTDEILVNQTTADFQGWAMVASEADGDFVVTWTSSNQDGTDRSVYARRFNADGTAKDGEFRVNTHNSDSQLASSVDVDAGNDFVITWYGSGPEGYGIYARRYASDGNALDAQEFRVTTGAIVVSPDPMVSTNSSGQFAIIAETTGNIYVNRYNEDGSRIGSEIGVETNILSVADQAVIALHDDGSFVVGWHQNNDIYARRYNASGNLIGSQFTVNSTTAGPQSEVSLSMDDSGNFMFTWTGEGTGDTDGVFAQRYDASGNALGGETLINYTTTGNQSRASVAMLSPTQYVVVWSGDGPGDTDGVYARMIGPASGENTTPNPDAGGAYTIDEGESLTLDASSSSDPDGSITQYQWDLNLDGVYGDVVTDSPTISWADLSTLWGIDDGVVAGTDYVIGLRVTDDSGDYRTDFATVTVTDVAPEIHATGTTTVEAGETYTLYFYASDDGDDTITSWTINWGDGHIDTVAGTESTVSHAYHQNGGFHNILISATDEDGNWHAAGSWVTSSAANPNDAVYEIDTTTGLVVGGPIGGTQLSSPGAIAVGPDGLLYVGSFGSQTVLRFDPETGSMVDTFVNDNNLNQVAGIAWGPDGNLYVASHGTGEIHRYDGETGARIDASNAPFISGLSGPIGLVFHNDGNLYVSNYNNNTIHRYDATTGTPVGGANFVSPGTLDGPEFMAFGNDDYLYVASYNDDSVYRFDESGNLVDAGAYISGGGLDGPVGISFGPDGLLYVTGENSSDIRRYDTSGPSAVFVDVYTDNASASDFRTLVFTPSHQVQVTESGASGKLWFSSTGNGSTTTLPSWTRGSVVEFGGSGLSFDPTGDPADTTAGEFSEVFDIDSFASGEDVDGLHYVEKAITIGGDSYPAFDLQAGDVLFSTKGSPTLTSTNSITVGKEDVVVFRPDSPGDYSSGTFTILLEDPMGRDLRGISLVENDMEFADGQTLAAGTFVFVTSGGSQDSNVYYYQVDDVGEATTAGTSGLLINGADINISDKLYGVEIIEKTTTIGGHTFQEGQILLALDSAGSVGSNSVDIETTDIFVLDVTQTALAGTTQATATKLLDGSDVELGDSNESIDAIALLRVANRPTDIQISNDNIDENVNTSGGHVVGTLSAVDPSLTDTHTFDVVGGSDESKFSVSGSNLILEDGILDYESQTQYNVVVKVTDSDGNELLKSLTIDVNNLNDVVPVVDANQSFSVSETANVGTSLGFITATDPDGTLQNWIMSSGNDHGLFGLNSSTGELTVVNNVNLDHEFQATYTLTIMVQDGQNTSSSQTVTVNVLDANDTVPVINPGQTFAVSESAPNGTAVGNATATDPDGTLQGWTITAGNGDGIFAINAGSGQITIADNSNLDHESASSHTLTLQVSDGANTSATQTVTINVIDVNDVVPEIDAGQTFNVAENVADNHVVGTATATDSDGTLQGWTITDGNGDGIFAINASSGQITIADNTNLDHESTDSYTLTLQVSDGANTSATQTITINVTDVNDVVPVIDAGQNFTVAENVVDNHVVGTATATDSDGTLQGWTITAGNGDGIFAINASSGQITIADNTNLDHESTDSYTLTLQVSDGANTSATQTITINVTDVNDVVPVINAGQTFTVAENVADNHVVGTATATDSDGTLQGWTITAGNGDGIFAINASSGQITIADNTNLDHESTDSYTLTLQVSDGANTSATQTITINVTDVNDVVPVIDAGQTFTVAENVADNHVVGTATATDSDGTLQGWTITAGNGDGIFAINASSGQITIADNSNLDHESTDIYTLTLQVSDGANTSATQTVTINVTDVNDVVPVIDAGQTFTVAENVADNHVVGTATATDSDGTLQGWTITAGNGDGIFAINASSGQITIADNSNLDHESTDSYTLTLQVSDGTNTSATQTVTINVSDVNEAATGTPGITGSAMTGQTLSVDMSSVSDPEGIQSEAFQWYADGVSLIGQTGSTITLDATHVGKAISVSVVVTDNTGNTESALSSNPTTPVGLTNAAPTDIVISGSQIQEGVDGDVVGAISVVDPDVIDTHVWSVDDGRFEIAAGQLRLKAGQSIDYDVESTLFLTVSVTDRGGSGATYTETIRVDVQESLIILPPALTLTSEPDPDPEPADASEDPGESNESADAEETAEEKADEAETAEAESSDSESSDSDSVSSQAMIRQDDGATANQSGDGNANGAVVDVLQLQFTDAQTSGDVQRTNVRGDGDSRGSSSDNPNGDGDENSSIDFALASTLGGETEMRQWKAMDQLRDDLLGDVQYESIVVGFAVSTAVAVSIGQAVWVVNAGYLASSALFVLPAWRTLDPLPVLDTMDGKFDDDDESLDSILDDPADAGE